jgi:hypothetical protein
MGIAHRFHTGSAGLVGTYGIISVYATFGTLDTIFAFFPSSDYTRSWRRVSVCSLPFRHVGLNRTPYWQGDAPEAGSSEDSILLAIDGFE